RRAERRLLAYAAVRPRRRERAPVRAAARRRLDARRDARGGRGRGSEARRCAVESATQIWPYPAKAGGHVTAPSWARASAGTTRGCETIRPYAPARLQYSAVGAVSVHADRCSHRRQARLSRPE